jgi:DNA-binding SARP family transcriptional activator
MSISDWLGNRSENVRIAIVFDIFDTIQVEKREMSENLSVYTFSGLQILQAGEPLAGVDSRKVEALFIYLALSERPQPREILADLLWNDRTQQQAQANLRRVLSGLRKHFGPYVEITRATAALNWENDLWLDARELQCGIEPLKAEPANLTPKIASKADDSLRLYHGDFLAGFHVRGARNFDAWLSEQREHWRQVMLDSVGTLAGFYESVQSIKEGIDLTRRALQVDPLQESIHRHLMRLLTLNGHRTDALQQYEQFRQILEDELGVLPEAETEALFEAIASGAFSVAQPSPTITPGAPIEGKERFSELAVLDTTLEITTLGGLSIHRDGQPVPSLHSRKAQALLVYLAVTARPQPREVLADLLWEEFSQKKAMNNLRVVLSNLRKHLGNHLLITRDTAAMNPEVDYDLDVAVVDANLGFAGDFERKTGTLDSDAVARIEQAVDLYKGEFLGGFFVENALEFDAWMVVERERLHHILLDGLGKLVRWELAQGEYTAGIRHASRWVQLDPLSETAHRQMMRRLVFS